MGTSDGQKHRQQAGFVTASEVGGAEGVSCGTEPLTCGIGCCLLVESVRTALTCRPSSWWPEDHSSHTHIGIGSRDLKTVLPGIYLPSEVEGGNGP